MKRYITILFICLYSIVLAQDTYPYFSDPNKQISFEEKKITIVETDETEEYYTHTGGESWTEMANTWGYILLDESPSYVVKQNPMKTQINYRHIYDFKILQGAKQITELEFLYYAGYTEKAKLLYDKYQESVELYNQQMENYQIKLQNHYNSSRIPYTESIITGYKKPISSWIPFLIGSGFLLVQKENGQVEEWARWPANAAFIWWFFSLFQKAGPIYEDRTLYKYAISNPELPNEPSIEQYFTNQQLTSLAEAYNRRLYEEIKSK